MMTSNPPLDRHSIRLKDYDYAASGAYFVTVCTYQRECLLGDLIDDEIQLSQYGNIAAEEWENLPQHYKHIELDAFIVMPNHIHGIICLDDGATRAGAMQSIDKPAPTNAPLSEVVRAFKTFSARKINILRSTPGTPFWQRGFYEHIIRNEVSLDKVREYIVCNPSSWATDKENPSEWRS